MDVLSLDIKKVKIAYIMIAGLLAICAIAAAFLHHQYIALGFIVLASAVILAGSYLVAYLHRWGKVKEIE